MVTNYAIVTVKKNPWTLTVILNESDRLSSSSSYARRIAVTNRNTSRHQQYRP